VSRRLAAVMATVLALLGWCTTVASAATVRPSVIVVGVPGLQWDQVTAGGTPTLWRLSHAGSVGALSIRSAATVTCPADGWLSIGAGNRVRAGHDSAVCAPLPAIEGQGPGARIDAYTSIASDNRSLDFGAVPGILASTVNTQDHGCVAAVGPGAALAAADRTGLLDYLRSEDATTFTSCPVTIVTAPTVATAAEATRADALVAGIDTQRPAGSVLLVVGLSDTDPRDRAHLHVAIAVGGPFGPGVLRSQSTRRAPYVQLMDVAPTVLQLRGLQGAPGLAAAVDGQPWEHTSGEATPTDLADADRAAGAVRAALPYGVALLVVLTTLGVALALVAWRRGRQAGGAGAVLLVAAAAPVATFLANVVPWWRTGATTATVLALTAGIAVVLGGAAALLSRKAGAVKAGGAVMGVTFLVLLADVVSGSRLQMDSILGYSPLVAGRFIGFGNVAFAVFGSAALLAATSAVVLRRERLWVAVAVGLVAVVGDGAPMWGSDVGGVLSLVPGFAVLVLLCAGVRVSWQRALAIAGAAAAVVLGFGLLDYARPPSSQTHLGRFVGKILHGGALTVLDRKAHSDLDLLTANIATLIVPVAAAVGVWLVVRPRPRLASAYDRMPPLRYGLVALVVLALVGLVVNDSGIAIPAVAVLLAVPYTVVLLTGDTAQSSTEPPPDRPYVLP
jgi:hypothetical protein